MVAKRLLALLMSAMLTTSLVACSSASKSSPDANDATEAEGVVAEADSKSPEVSEASEGAVIRASKDSSELTVSRPSPGGEQPQDMEEDTWTILCYFCGSDLETEYGAATDNMAAMVDGSVSENVRFIVETGGAKKWSYEEVDPDYLQRLIFEDGSVGEADRLPTQSMGEPETLSDFVSWGVKEYPSEHMGLILWDHGGGTLGGVCYDELNDDDSLSLNEIDQALGQSFQSMWDKLDFVGFDACLMSTIETANTVASYADYLYASQDVEPATGWDYEAMGSYLAKNPDASGEELGKVVTDSYFELIDFNEIDPSSSTFAVTDLSLVDNLLSEFNVFSKDLYEATADESTLASVVRAVHEADSFGANNEAEGYTDMVDLKGVVVAGEDTSSSSSGVIDVLGEAVVYHREGSDHEGAGGLSVFYPLSTSTSEDLEVYESVCVSPYYLSFIDRQTHGSVTGDVSDYNNDVFFDDDGTWNHGLGINAGINAGSGASTSGYWSYADEANGESTIISFAEAPQVTDDGTYWVQLDQKSIDNTDYVQALLYEVSADGKDMLAIGQTFEVNCDWDTGVIEDAFDGLWLSLPDRQNLCAYIVDWTDTYTVFTCPIEYNGDNAYLRLRVYDEDYRVEVEGVWDGISDIGAADRNMKQIKKGDTIKPLYDAYGLEEGEESTYEGEVYTVEDDFTVYYDELDVGDYLYEFDFTDVYGQDIVTDPVMFTIDDKGDIYFEF